MEKEAKIMLKIWSLLAQVVMLFHLPPSLMVNLHGVLVEFAVQWQLKKKTSAVARFVA